MGLFQSAQSSTEPPEETITFVCDETTIITETFEDLYVAWLSLAIPKLKKLGYKTEKVDWKDQNIKWDSKWIIIIGPIWNYSDHIKQFEKWIESLQQMKLNIYNNTEFLKWNYNKNYLLDLKRFNEDILIPKTLIVQYNEQETDKILGKYQTFCDSFETKTIVIKGVVDSLGKTFKRIENKNKFNNNEFIKYVQYLQTNNNGAIIQCFQSEFTESGEIQFCFYNDKLSHGVIKISRKNSDNTNIGDGTRYFYLNAKLIHDICYAKDIASNIAKTFRDDINQNLIANNIVCAAKQIDKIYQCVINICKKKKIIHYKKDKLLYLRIDGIIVDNRFMVTEIEGIEPYMAFGVSPEYVVDNYVNAIDQQYQTLIKEQKGVVSFSCL